MLNDESLHDGRVNCFCVLMIMTKADGFYCIFLSRELCKIGTFNRDYEQ